MKNVVKIIIIIVIILLFTFTVLYFADMKRMEKGEKVIFSTWGRDYAPAIKKDKPNTDYDNIGVVLSLEDPIYDNTVWCGTFNIIWNDLKNEIALKDIIFENQTEVIDNLNKGTFDVSNLSDSSYYKVCAHPSLELKEHIENAIKEKFNETSDILNQFDFKNVSKEDYFLYCMLSKRFEFEKKFEKLDNDKFGNYEDVKYFGIDSKTKAQVKSQIKVLYYNSKDDFAVKLITKTNDEIIVEKGSNKSSFYDIYMNILDEESKYKGSKNLNSNDTFKMPIISLNIMREIKEVENNDFTFSDGSSYKISKAVQTIKFELDENGGKIKSEAGMLVNRGLSFAEEPDARNLDVDNTFTLFLIEENASFPYFAAKISDITKFQYQ